MKICLNMIVKNEEARIVRALASCAQFIDCYAIVDTGSSDRTKAVIREFFEKHEIPGHITDAPFEDWSQARNAALSFARQYAPNWTHCLLMDADMELVVKDWDKFQQIVGASTSAVDMEQRAGTLHYLNRRLVAARATGWYRGVTHEYLDIPGDAVIPNAVAYFIDHADGANRPDKYKRDIALLLKGIQEEPNNERYYFYLAQSYRDAGQHADALHWYRRRVDAGGWDEERWNAQLNAAHCLKAMGDEAGFIREALLAYNMRPSRAESLYDLARHFRDKPGHQAIGALFSEVGMSVPRSNDALFVNDFVYAAGMEEEFSICAYYVPHRRKYGFEVTDFLSQASGPHEHVREGARHNLFYYMPTLKEVAPSFEWQEIEFKPPHNLVALNPSITVHNNKFHVVVRTVNYRINEHGQYLIRGTDGSVNNHNPISTRNWLLQLSDELTPQDTTEIVAPNGLPCEYPLVIGFEDMRLFSWKGDLWTSSTVRQFHSDGNCEQVLARLSLCVGPDVFHGITDVHRMLRQPRGTEKNWSPIVDGDNLQFMWRPGTVVDTNGATVSHNPPPGLNVDNISGSSQLVALPGDNWLALVHSARHLPGSPCRYYYHRFAFYDNRLRLAALSPPFVFNEKSIEFAAGMCRHPRNPQQLVFSYGSKDCSARLGTMHLHDAMRLTWSRSK